MNIILFCLSNKIKLVKKSKMFRITFSGILNVNREKKFTGIEKRKEKVRINFIKSITKA